MHRYFFLSFLIFLLFSTPVQAQEPDFVPLPETFNLSLFPANLPLSVAEKDFSLSQKEVSSWTKESSKIIFNPHYQSEIENGNYFCRKERALICRLLVISKLKNHLQKKSSVALDKNQVADYVEYLSTIADKNPEDARLKIEDGKVSVFSLSNSGTKLDKEKAVIKLISYITNNDYSQKLVLPTIAVHPETTIDSIDNMGIKELIGEGRSNFRGSPKNRIFNIKVATERFNGILIKPGEEFSFVKVLGEVDGEHGYLPELVIKQDKTEPEFGGGICQVSTTAFRAAIYSGLEITARRNHAYPVSYYNPQGMDSTVYVPRPDLRFINNTPAYILIQTKIEGTELIFDFYGTSDGRRTNIIGPKVLERNPDGSMKTVFTQEIYDKENNLVRSDVFKSSYDSPDKYPHPGSTSDILTEKPKNWSDREWRVYKKQHNLP
jgi:vancomycin resistance protein YoaR